jgi:ABC-type transporter Mla MlaB component
MTRSPPRTIVCDVSALSEPDLRTIDALAHLQLAARRLDAEIVLHGAPRELAELIVFAGLENVLLLEPRGQPEEREQRLGLEEEGELDDPAI